MVGKQLRIGIVAVLAAAVLVGCGGKSEHQHFVSSANAICRASGKQAKAINPTGKASLATVATKAAAVVDDLRAKLGRLSPSAGDRARYDRFLVELNRRRALGHAVAAAARRGRVDEVRKLIIQTQHELATLNRLARQLGLKFCRLGGG